MSTKLAKPKEVIENNKGEGIVFAVIGLALVLIAATILIAFPSIRKSSVNLASTDNCQSRANEIVSAFTSSANKMIVTPWHPMPGDLTPPNFTLAPGLARLPAGLTIAPAPGAAVTAANVNSWALVDASYNWLAQYYNTFPAACSTATEGFLLTPIYAFFFVSPFSITGTSQLKGEQIFLNIQRQNLLTNAIDCVSPALMLPTNANNAGTTPPIGLKITATVHWKDNDSKDKVCTATTMLKPDSDVTPPAPMGTAAIVANQLLNPAPGACGIPPAIPLGPSVCECTNGICLSVPCVGGAPCTTYGGVAGAVPGFAAFQPYSAKQLAHNFGGGLPSACADAGTLKVDLSFTTISSEPATIYACSINSMAENSPAPGPSPNFFNCNGYNIGGITGNISARNPASGVAGPTSGIRFDTTSVPIGTHTLTLRGIDSSRNTADSSLSFAVIRPCPNSWTQQFCPGTPAPSVCGEPNKCVGNKPPSYCPDPMSQLCGVPLLDECGNVCGAGIAKTADVFDGTFAGSKPGPCGWCTIIGTCVDIPDNPLTPLVDETFICPVAPPCNDPIPGPANSCQATGMNCPTLRTADPLGALGNTYTQTGGQASYQFMGGSVAAGCTMNFVGATDPNAAAPGTLYGPSIVPPAIDPITFLPVTPIFQFGMAGPGNSAGTRDLSLTCGGLTSTCRYQSTCVGATCTTSTVGCLP